jgi:hypothetical protein
MKYLFLLILLFFTFTKQISAIEKPVLRKKSYSFKNNFSSQKKFRTFVNKLINTNAISSPEEIKKFIDSGTKNLFIHKFVAESPLLSKFVYKSIITKNKLADFLYIFIEKNKIIIFFFILIGTFILSHIMKELKFKYPIFSVKRVSFFFFRFFTVNSIRIIAFNILFYKHFSGILDIFYQEVATLQEVYPKIHIATAIVVQITEILPKG